MTARSHFRCLLACVIAGTALSLAATAQTAADRIATVIDETRMVTLEGNTHPLAQPEFDRGSVDPDTRLESLMIELRPSAAQQRSLDSFVEQQQNPRSPLFHHWLTPDEFGSRFGSSSGDIARISSWLAAHGFSIDEIPANHRLIVFSGTAGQVEDAFHPALHRYAVEGVEHIANSQDPQIPAALVPVVGGIVSLHDFRRASAVASRHAVPELNSSVDAPISLGVAPQMTSGSKHYLFPADFATIYDINPIYGVGLDGTGISISILGRSDVKAADLASFRTFAGLPAAKPQIILAGRDPGLVANDQIESTLDLEWAGAIAPGATVKFVTAASTATTDGVDLAASYAVNHVTSPVLSISYASCEQQMGASELAFYTSLWQQAASQGITVFAASGDSGAAGCDPGRATKGTVAAVNGICSSPSVTCVGGTEFNDAASPSRYWSAIDSSNQGSALGYIPEIVWNESGPKAGQGLWASGGGISHVSAQPAWQKSAAGIAQANGMRAVPDVALNAASHDGYMISLNGSWWVVSGTSAAAPSMAGIMALVLDAQAGESQGSANPGLYSLAAIPSSPFHLTHTGNNTVPGVSGFTATGTPYNLASGLGSVDAGLLVANWGDGNPAKPGADFTLAAIAASSSIKVGAQTNVTITAAGAGAKRVALSVKVSSGIKASAPATIVPGGAKVTLTALAAGNQTVSFTGSDASGSQTITVTLAVTAK